jgi:hypothetical protein
VVGDRLAFAVFRGDFRAMPAGVPEEAGAKILREPEDKPWHLSEF